LVNNTPKDIAVFIDGTWNSHSSLASTNIRKLYGATRAGKIAGRRKGSFTSPV
jgi:uncharacterized protein (DUF2235 family)